MVTSGTKWEKVGDMAGMLLGQFEAIVGDKNRIAFPKKLREIIGNKLIITLGYENSLIIVGQEGWKALLEGTEGLPWTFGPARATQRFILGGASQIELDAKGRFILPVYLRSYAKITGEIVFVGLSLYVELWDKRRWEVYRKELEKKIGTIAERLVGSEKREEKK